PSLESRPAAATSHVSLRIGDAAPNFAIHELGGGNTVALSQLRGKPVVLYFGSCTCPHFRASIPQIKRIFDLYRLHAHVFVVYTQEAHPVVPLRGPDREIMAQREKMARDFAAELEIALPILIDDADNKVQNAYRAAPERIYVIDAEGRIAYASEPGPL